MHHAQVCIVLEKLLGSMFFPLCCVLFSQLEFVRDHRERFSGLCACLSAVLFPAVQLAQVLYCCLPDERYFRKELTVFCLALSCGCDVDTYISML